MLTKNSFLAQLMCLFGLHEYILFERQVQKDISAVESQLNKFDKKKKAQENDRDTNNYIQYTFDPAFRMNEFKIEPFKTPKILGDVLEAIIGAVFLDGGIEELVRVLRPMLSPFVVYVAKFSKNIHKEPKEDCGGLASQLNMKPAF